MPETVTASLARHLTSLRFEALPAAAVAAAKKTMIDTLAVAWAGTRASGVSAAIAVAREQAGTAESTIWGCGGKLPAASAAMTNAVLAAALDFDSHYLGVHSDGVVLPAALAIAERQSVSGREFLTALVAANDIVCRFGKAAQGLHRGWYNTSIYGIFGAVAATTKLLALDEIATRHAFGLALAQASGNQQPAVEHTLAMRFQAGFAARAGVLAGLLAAKGVSASAESIEGKFGFYSLYQPGSPESVLAELGVTYFNDQMAFKKYPCCACSHAAIEAALSILAEHRPAATDIAHAIVRISPDMDRLVGERTVPGADPEVAAQFSVRHAVACTLYFGEFSIQHLRPACLTDEALAAFTQRITVEVDPALSGKFVPAEVEVILNTGVAARCRVESMPGTPAAPIGPAMHDRKLAECFGSGAKALDTARVQILRERISRLESLPDMGAFFDGILTAHSTQ